MSDPVIALILVICLYAGIAVVRFFKTLDGDFWRAAMTPAIAGLIAGFVIRLIPESPELHATVIGVVVTVAALYARLTGEETEPIDGMLIGAAGGAAAALPLVMDGGSELQAFSACVLAGAVAGYGVTFAIQHVGDKLRQALLDVVTAGVAVGVAHLPMLLQRVTTDRIVAITTTALIPLIALAALFQQWPDVRAELRHEASLGFMNDSDVRATAHPFLRLGRAGWTDPAAHREFVRVANRIALRKRQQRNRSGEMARLYQLEIIKLRMQLQEMSQIDRDVTIRRRAPREHDDEVPSDTMARQ